MVLKYFYMQNTIRLKKKISMRKKDYINFISKNKYETY